MVPWRSKLVVKFNQYTATGNVGLRKEQKRSTNGSERALCFAFKAKEHEDKSEKVQVDSYVWRGARGSGNGFHDSN